VNENDRLAGALNLHVDFGSVPGFDFGHGALLLAMGENAARKGPFRDSSDHGGGPHFRGDIFPHGNLLGFHAF
jgi:hypothetical protein